MSFRRIAASTLALLPVLLALPVQADDLPTQIHVRTGAQISALVPGGTAKVTFVLGTVVRGLLLSDRIVCIQVSTSSGADHGCSTDAQTSMSTDLLLNNGQVDVVVASATTPGAVLRAKVSLHGIGSYIVERPFTIDVGPSRAGASLTAKTLRKANVSGTVTSTLGGGGTLLPGSSGSLFQGGEASIQDETRPMTRESVSSLGVQAIGESFQNAISADGRYVAFTSSAATLVPGDTNVSTDVFVRDRLAGVTSRVSVSSRGSEAAFASRPAVSADGRYVAYYALLLDEGEGLFVRDLVTSQTSMVSGTVNGRAALSGDGRYVAYGFSVIDRLLNSEERFYECSSVPCANVGVALSADGRRVAWTASGSGTGVADVFVRDLPNGSQRRITAGLGGANANGSSGPPAITPDGRYVAFTSAASNLVPGDVNGAPDVFVYDVQSGVISLVSFAQDGSAPGIGAGIAPEAPSISADARRIAFTASSPSLVAGDTNGVRDVFVRDLAAGTTTRASTAQDSSQAAGASGAPSLSADAAIVVFDSLAPNLIVPDANGGAGRAGSDVYAKPWGDA